MKKRILAIIVCLAMVFTTFGYMGIENAAVQTAEATTEVEAEASEETVSTDNEVELSIFDQLMAAEDTTSMYNLIEALMESNSEDVEALTCDEINALLDKVDELDPNCTNENTDRVVDVLITLPNFVSGAEEEGETGQNYVLADDHTFDANETIDQEVTIKDDDGGDSNWKIKNGKVIINKTITIPKGESLDIQIHKDDTDGVGTIQAGEDLGDDPMFIVKGTLKIGYSPTQNYGEIRVIGGTIRVDDGGIIYAGEIESIRDTVKIDLNGKGKMYVAGDIPVYGTLNITGDGANTSLIKAIENSTAVSDTKTGEKLTANGKYMFIVGITQKEATGRLNLSEVTVDGGANWSGDINSYINRGENNTGLKCGFVRVNQQKTKDPSYEFEAKNTIFTNGEFGQSLIALYYRADAYLSGITVQNCTDLDGDGVIRCGKLGGNNAIADTESDTRTFIIKNSTLKQCKSAKPSGGIIRTNGTVYVDMTIDNLTMQDNYSNGWGNILWNAIGECNIKDSTFTHNTSAKRGGAISSEGLGMEITGCSFVNNHAGDYGGAIAMFPYTLVGKDAVTSGNELTMNVAIDEGCTFENNTAPKGGAVAIFIQASDSALSTTLNASINLGENGYMKNNSATNGGGAIYAGCTVADVNLASKLNLNINSGSIYSNESPKGGAVLVDDVRVNNTGVNTVTVNGGVIGGENTPNTAENGGAIAIEEGNFIMNGGVISHNTASQNGGAAYISGGNASMNGGSILKNTAVDGGAIYINGGDFVMQGGNIENNTASGNGGAAYIAGGDATIYHGTIDNNKAVKGGAVYMAESDATLIMESGTMNYNEASDDGGAIYANGGLIKIGLEDCKNEDENGLASCTHHTVKGDNRHHPQINNNKAADTGGGIAIGNSGTVHFYCGTANDNEALYKGVGKNVFMNGGEIFLYTGADVGVPRDPDLVIIGGTLHNQCEPNPYLNLYYYENNTEECLQPYQGLAELDEYMNLPEGEYFWTADEGYTFFGWTPYGPQSAEGNNEVRTKDDYKPSGTPVQINDTAEIGEAQGTYDGTADNSMNLYALWAPIVNDITYVDGLTKTEMSDLDTNTYPATYSIDKTVAQDISIPEVEKPGYKIVGWYIYQDENQNANWSYSYEDEDGVRQRVSYEPQYVDDISGNQKGYDTLDYEKMKASGQYIPADDNGDITLHIDALTFGDITLIAEYEPQFTDLKITKSADVSLDENQTFLFRVIGKPYDDEVATIDMTVAVEGAGSTVIEELPVGTYSVTEIIDWSWRYDYTSAILKTNGSDYVIASDNGGSGVFGLTGIELVDPDKVYDVTFTNSRVYQYWLSGDAFSLNQFTKPLDKLPEKIQ